MVQIYVYKPECDDHPDYKPWIEKDEDNINAYCKVCPALLTSRKHVLQRHMKTKKHVDRMQSAAAIPIEKALSRYSEVDDVERRLENNVSMSVVEENVVVSEQSEGNENVCISTNNTDSLRDALLPEIQNFHKSGDSNDKIYKQYGQRYK